MLAGCTDDMTVMREETFGPVAPVCVVPSFEAALEAASRSAYGLAASVLTLDGARAGGLAQAAGRHGQGQRGVRRRAWWCCGTARGRSGSGFGYGPELLDEMSTTKVVHLSPAG